MSCCGQKSVIRVPRIMLVSKNTVPIKSYDYKLNKNKKKIKPPNDKEKNRA